MRQAARDLEHAVRALESTHYEWACFAAQQSAEKAVKALFLRANRIAWGHSVAALLQQLPLPWQPDESLVNAGKELDKHYIPPRYPNSYPEGAPYEYYTRAEAERAIGHTRDILAFCERLLAGPEPDSQSPEDGSPTTGATPPGD
ncbi:MAG TPA: HEPN domain-containing protein [Anaerolineales bacterium]|nr:HEPN domain-containing protein [Anaerolineales bacterium]